MNYGKYYRAYRYMQDLLTSDFTHKYLERAFEDGDKGKDILTGKTNEKVIDMDWVEAIEEALPYIQNAIDEQRRFIKQVENVVRIDKAKKITPDSVKHLAQHTSFIAKVEGDKVTPNKILNVEREESFEIYENRMLITLINNTLRFVDDKYTNLKNAPTDSFNKIKMVRHLELNQQKIDFDIDYINESHEDLAEDLDVDVSELSDFDRIRKVRRTLNDFLATPLMKSLVKSTPVRPPLQQTNLLKKNPNFKKAVELWSFIDSYKKPGFEVVGEEFSGEMPQHIKNDLYLSAGFEHFMMTISTNPALRRLLENKFDEENMLAAEEKNRPEAELRTMIEAQITARTQEEMNGYLNDIRDREHQIIDLKATVNNLKMTVEQKEQQNLVLKGQVSALQDQVEELTTELKSVKLQLVEAQNKIKEQEEVIELQKEEIRKLEEEASKMREYIAELEKERDALKAEKERLEAENKELLAKVYRYESEIKDLKFTIEQLKGQIAEMKLNELSLKDTISSQQAQIREIGLKVDALAQKNREVEESLENEKQEHRKDLENQKESYESKISEITNSFNAEKEQLNKDFEMKLASIKAETAETLSRAEKDYSLKLSDMQSSFNKEKELSQTNFNKETQSLKKHYESRIQTVEKDKDKAYSHEEKKFNEKLAKAEKQLNAEHNRKLKQVKSDSAAEIAQIKRKARAEIKAVKIKARKKMFTKEELENIDN